MKQEGFSQLTSRDRWQYVKGASSEPAMGDVGQSVEHRLQAAAAPRPLEFVDAGDAKQTAQVNDILGAPHNPPGPVLP